MREVAWHDNDYPGLEGLMSRGSLDTSAIDLDLERSLRRISEPPRRLACLCRAPVDLEVVIPALNEENRLAPTLERTINFLADRPWSSSIVVVDNGSVDGTVEVASRYRDAVTPVHLIGCSCQGKGAAVRRGFMTSQARFLGFMDADMATHLEAIDDAMALLSEGHSAVIGSRHSDGSQVGAPESAIRRLGGLVFRKLARRAVHSVEDTQCGFKFFRGDLARHLMKSCRVDGFAFDVELLSLIQQAGHDITELPVAWDWDGESTFRIGHDAVPTFVDIIRFRSRFGSVTEPLPSPTERSEPSPNMEQRHDLLSGTGLSIDLRANGSSTDLSIDLRANSSSAASDEFWP